MRLTNSKGDVFELKIRDYAFPEIENQIYSSDGLDVQIQCRMGERNWVASDHCLFNWEVNYILKWFTKIRDAQTLRSKRCGFIEPYLAFELVETETNKFIRVYLQHLLRPSWAYRPFVTGDDDFWLQFPITEISFEDVINDLQTQFDKFPNRALHLMHPKSVSRRLEP